MSGDAQPIRAETRAGGWRGVLARPAVRRGVQIGIVGLIALFFVRAVVAEWPEVVAYQWRIGPGYLGLALLLLLTRAPVQALGWKIILGRLGYGLGWRATFRIYFQSALAKY